MKKAFIAAVATSAVLAATAAIITAVTHFRGND